jgi:hypothetical protein
MGCDIHLVLEEKDANGKWVGINTFMSHDRASWTVGNRKRKPDIFDVWSSPVARDRNYARFSALADVRSYDRVGPKPRGVPDDASETTKHLINKWGVDGHSHSWLSLKEATKIWVETENDDMINHHQKYAEYHFFGVEALTEDPKEFDKYRIVFWFDN